MAAEWLVPRLSYVRLVYETSTQTNRFFSKAMLLCLCASQTLDNTALCNSAAAERESAKLSDCWPTRGRPIVSPRNWRLACVSVPTYIQYL